MIDVILIIKKVVLRLSCLDFEKDKGCSDEQLIFPQKYSSNGDTTNDRISEQELRLLFIEEFKIAHPDLFYSIETPTVGKYSFGESYDNLRQDSNGRSASLDMCIFERELGNYNRILNIEFKHKNSLVSKTGKDILKLIQEKQNGVFIHLLENTDSGTLSNAKATGVLDKLHKSFSDFKGYWHNSEKSIQLIILSLEQTQKKRKTKITEPVLIHRTITKSDLDFLDEIFFKGDKLDSIKDVNKKGWRVESNGIL
jgi:hypothetical protein